MDLNEIISELSDTIGPLGALVIIGLGWFAMSCQKTIQTLHDKHDAALNALHEKNDKLQQETIVLVQEHSEAVNKLAREIVEVTSGVKVALERALEDARRG